MQIRQQKSNSECALHADGAVKQSMLVMHPKKLPQRCQFPERMLNTGTAAIERTRLLPQGGAWVHPLRGARNGGRSLVDAVTEARELAAVPSEQPHQAL